jgi:TolB-like protein/tetratricopeptide (TPR) repeat protein
VRERGGSDQVNGSGTTAPQDSLAPNPSSALFISYASQDKRIADAMCAALERDGVACWIAPRNVRPGDFYADAIVNAINACPALVLVLSKNSVDSAHVLREVERASAKERPVIAFRIDTTPLPPGLEYFLSASQWIEAGSGTPEREFPKLVEALRGRISSTPTAEVGRPIVTPAANRGRKRIVIVVAAVVAAALLVLLIDDLWLSNRATTGQAAIPAISGPSAILPAGPAVSEKSIAVLPFTDMSEKKDQEYFADGMAEEVIDLLDNIPGITVIGRTSSFQFKDKNDDLRTIGTRLNVAHVLEGSVRRSGDHVRVTAQLIDTRTGAHEWSETFDRNMDDVLKLQDQIAAGLARALEVTVGAGDLPARTTIKDPEAYQFYLRGRHAIDRSDKDGDDEAAADFQKALDLEPTFANAAAYLARTRADQAANGYTSYATGFEDARRLAETALRLDPSLAAGHCILADYYTRFAWDWQAADREARRAIELDSRGVCPLQVSASLQTTLGHWDEAVRLLNTALELDPLNAELYWDLGNERYRSGRFPEADAAFRRILQISPTFVSAHFELGRVLLARGQLRDALREMEQESPEPESGRTAGLAMVYFALGRRADSDAAIKKLEAESGEDWPFGMAETYAYRGEADKALQWLERSYSHKDELHLIKGDPMFEKIEQDPRYKAFLRKMNLLE